ncbi:MAG: sensor histidine kinase [Bacteroidetes bacterium]|nr:MAG: sensor histidine kinase [Bacteroidota bacterium]TAG88667.1 MAG: sensor histidine kinase [Bacteroidota bacterium]
MLKKVTAFQVLLFIAYNLFLMFVYGLSLYINLGGKENFVPRLLIDYTAKAIVIVPFWWLMIIFFKHIELKKRLFFHILLCPLYVWIWLQAYHFVCDIFGVWYMRGLAQVWDLYIPFLMYLSQFGIFHIYEYYTRYQLQLIEQNELRQAKLKSELTALKAQINPHFLYNIFNTINASLPPEQEQTRELIAKLSDLFRYQLQISEQDFITIEEEIDFLDKYLFLEQARFKDKLSIKIDVQKEIKKYLIPSLILQPLVENAIKHAISPKISNGIIEINVFQKNNEIYFSVKDNGKKLDNLDNLYNNEGIGLKNTRLRLEKLYQETLYFNPIEPEGLEVYFKIKQQLK